MAGRSSLGKELGSLERRRFLCISQHAQLVLTFSVLYNSQCIPEALVLVLPRQAIKECHEAEGHINSTLS